MELYGHDGEEADNELEYQILMIRKNVTSKQKVGQTPEDGKYEKYEEIGVSSLPGTATESYYK